MKLKDAISKTKAYKPHAFSEAQATDWINQLEAEIYTDVLLIDAADFRPYVWPDDAEAELFLPAAHESLYPAWLEAMIDYHNGEYDRYANTLAVFNQRLNDYKRYICYTYTPANRLQAGRRRR